VLVSSSSARCARISVADYLPVTGLSCSRFSATPSINRASVSSASRCIAIRIPALCIRRKARLILFSRFDHSVSHVANQFLQNVETLRPLGGRRSPRDPSPCLSARLPKISETGGECRHQSFRFRCNGHCDVTRSPSRVHHSTAPPSAGSLLESSSADFPESPARQKIAESPHTVPTRFTSSNRSSMVRPVCITLPDSLVVSGISGLSHHYCAVCTRAPPHLRWHSLSAVGSDPAANGTGL